MRHLEHAHRAGRADRAATDHAVVKRHGLAVGTDEEVFVGRCRRGFAAIKGFDFASVGMQEKSAAANAARLRLDQRQHHLHGNGRINGRAAGLESLVARFGGQWVGRRNGEFGGRPAGLGGKTTRAFGLLHDGAGAGRAGRRSLWRRMGGGCIGAGGQQAANGNGT